jgi:hypothetical protein
VTEGNISSLYLSELLQTTVAANEHLPEGQFLIEEQTLDKVKCLGHRAGTRGPTVSRKEREN